MFLQNSKKNIFHSLNNHEQATTTCCEISVQSFFSSKALTCQTPPLNEEEGLSFHSCPNLWVTPLSEPGPCLLEKGDDHHVICTLDFNPHTISSWKLGFSILLLPGRNMWHRHTKSIFSWSHCYNIEESKFKLRFAWFQSLYASSSTTKHLFV